ncbi:MAG: nucleotide sugar dehydrogenase [Alphaproteobacteria bacterium]|nr:nucleotide sugar dehydrogenase [Alphaproteobacteria bacterium]
MDESTQHFGARLVQRLRAKEATIGVIGLGYVGLPICLAAAHSGLNVVGFDMDPVKPDMLLKGESYLHHIPAQPIKDVVAQGRFTATSDFARLAEPDALLVCVPTPLDAHFEPDLSFIEQTSETIARFLRRGQLVVLESTTYPGTTAEVMRPILEKCGLVCDKDFFIAFSPEREDPGNESFTTSTIPKVVGADTAVALDAAVALYDNFVTRTVPVSSSRVAEAVKLTENIFRSVNIALVNELKIIYEAMGIDVWEVIDGAKTKPFGFMPFYPGPGLGGHCIPIDPFYLTWKAREFGVVTRFIELAGEINSSMPRHVVSRLALALDMHCKKGLNGSKILVMGVAYKKNIDDMRESPSLRLIELLEARGAVVEFYDAFVPVIPHSREHMSLAGRRSAKWAPNLSSGYDAVLIVTDHDNVDYAALVENAALVVDTRNACRRAGVHSPKVSLA